MSHRLKLNLLVAVVILAFSYWAANPGVELHQFHLLPLGASGTLATTLGWLARITIIAGLFYLARFIARRNVKVSVSRSDDHAVIIELKLSSEMGTPDEVTKTHAIEDELERAIMSSGTGELDGDEFGGNHCTIYLYGPDADKLYRAVRPVLDKFPAASGSFVIRRFGKPGSKQIKTELSDHEQFFSEP